MGISDEIEVAKIAIDETTLLEIFKKLLLRNDHKLSHSDKHYCQY